MNKTLQIKKGERFSENIFSDSKKKPEIIETKKVILPKYKIKELSEKLIESVHEKNIPKINELIREGADINYVQEHSGKNVVRIAVEKDSIEIVRILGLNGADLEKLDRDNKDTCLIHAIKSNSIDMVETLIKAKVSVNKKDELGNTPLIWACGKNKIEIVTVLTNQLCNLNVQNKEGNTALIYATMNKNYDILRLLIEKGADKNIKNNRGQDALKIISLQCLNGYCSNIFDLLEGKI
jgi:uncharacterized protein